MSRHGAQGLNDEASKQILENEFGTHNVDECITKILEGGSIQETAVCCQADRKEGRPTDTYFT